MKAAVPTNIKLFLKKYFWNFVFYNKIFGSSISKNRDYLLQVNKPTSPSNKLNIFTSSGEDGILLRLINAVGCTNKKFVDIGSNDCINSNCANLAFHHNWKGVFIEGDKKTLARGKYIYTKHFKKNINRFSFVNAIVEPNNINAIIKKVIGDEEVEVLSIDLDGNDYHIWKAIDVIKPKIVVVEVQIEKGNIVFIPKYENNFELFEDNQPKGASPLSMVKLAETKGYQLVAANNEGYNLFFVRNECMSSLKKLNLEDVLSII